mgnify:CR=1 FL=1
MTKLVTGQGSIVDSEFLAKTQKSGIGRGNLSRRHKVRAFWARRCGKKGLRSRDEIEHPRRSCNSKGISKTSLRLSEQPLEQLNYRPLGLAGKGLMVDEEHVGLALLVSQQGSICFSSKVNARNGYPVSKATNALL